MKFGRIQRIFGRREIDQPKPKLPHRGGGRLEMPTPAGGPKKWEPSNNGTTVAARPRHRRRARVASAAPRNA